MLILKCFYFLLPAGLANMAPVFAKNINFLKYPMDFNLTFRSKRILGDHKTWRGFFSAVIIGIIFCLIQKYVYQFSAIQKISLIDYSTINPIILGIILGAGAMIGDCIKSFFKRQINIQPGECFIFFDQVDWVIGSLLLSTIYIRITLTQIIISLILFFLLHILMKHIGYYLKLDDKKW